MRSSGACLCGAIELEIEQPYLWVAHCHCSMCRKHHGGLFSTSVGVDRARFRLLAGADRIRSYRATGAFARAFCGRCGVKVPALSQRADVINVPAGLLAAPGGVRPRTHIFAGSRSPHVTLDDVLPRHRAYPPGVDLPEVPWPPPGRPPAPVPDEADAPAGSCLCGEVAYEVMGGLLAAAHCRCPRCCRGRGSAYATTATAPLEALRWTRGRALVARYAQGRKLTAVSAFCRRCGSLMPVQSLAAGLALVPAGSLDTPCPEPTSHAPAGATAAWFLEAGSSGQCALE